MLLCEVGSDANFWDIRFTRQRTGAPPHRVNHRISTRRTVVYILPIVPTWGYSRVICGGGLCEEASRVQEAIRTTKVDSLPLQVPHDA